MIPGRTVWITDTQGREEKVQIIEVSGDTLTVVGAYQPRRLRTADILRVRARKSDSVLNGALIGAGVGVASGLLMCTAMESWDVCRDDIGPLTAFGALGAGIGIGIDALIRGRKTIYEAPQGPAQVHVGPIVGRRAGGVQVSITF